MCEHLDDYLAWLRLRGLAGTTITKRRTVITMIATSIRATCVAAIGRDQLDDWQKAQQQLAPQSMRCYLSHLSAFFTWAVAAGHITSSPVLGMVRPKVPHRLPQPIDEDDLTFALATATDRVLPWLVLAAYAGLRACEISAMERTWVLDTWDPPVLRVIGKGNKERAIPASPIVLEHLRPYLRRREPWLFDRRDHLRGPVPAGQVSHVANAHLAGMGIPATLHKLRHRFGTRIYALTGDLRLTQELMGHSDPRTTAGYVAYCQPGAAAAVLALGETA